MTLRLVAFVLLHLMRHDRVNSRIGDEVRLRNEILRNENLKLEVDSLEC